MGDNIEKKSNLHNNPNMDTQSFDNGAVEQLQSSFEFSPLAEKKLVRKIDRTSVALL